jgi:flagellar motor switch protein FliN/FliY
MKLKKIESRLASMTEDKHIDNPTEENSEVSAEENRQEGNTQKEFSGNTETPDDDKSKSSAADEPADRKKVQIEETSEPTGTKKEVSEKMEPVEDFDLDLLLDIPLEITVELGRAKIQIQELLDLGPGSTVTLSKLEGEPVDILANDKLIARGEVVLQNKKYGIRITEITSRMNRIKSLS